MSRQRYERTDVPTASPLRTVLSIVAILAVAAGCWLLWQTLWSRAQFDSAKGDAQLASAITNAPTPAGIDGYVTSDHEFDDVLVLIVDDVSAEAPALADAKVLCLDVTAGTGTLVTLPTNVRVNPDTNPQTLEDLFATSGAGSCVSAVSKRCGIPVHHVVVTDASGWERMLGLGGSGEQGVVRGISGLMGSLESDLGGTGLVELVGKVASVGASNLVQLDTRPGSEWDDEDGVTWMVVYDHDVAPAVGYLVPEG